MSSNCKNTIAISTKKNISLLGVRDLIVIETSDCVLVLNKEKGNLMKPFIKDLSRKSPNLVDEHNKVNRPWGWFEILEEDTNYKVKLIQINPGKSISLQKHNMRSEHWVVVKGKATITKGKENFILKINESTFIDKGQIHRLSNNTKFLLQIIEVQSGEYLGEDDIERIEDNYGR